jgi:topoisomerase-4 subunit B
VARSYRDGLMREAIFDCGKLVSETEQPTEEENGTYIYFEPDKDLFLDFKFQSEFVNNMLRNYTYLNTGLAIFYNGRRIISRNGLEDLLNDSMTAPGLYPIVHLKGDGIDIAFTHTSQYGEEYYSFVNGQHTTQGGTHQSAFKEHIARTIKEYFGKNFDVQDVRNGLVAAIAIRVIEPLFESQTKIKLGSLVMAPDKDMHGNPFPLSGVSVNKFVGDFIKSNVDNYLHMNLDVAEILQQKIQESEKERKAIAGVTKLARERAKKANLHNRKLCDCRVHLNDAPPKTKKGQEEENDLRFDSSIFITEGDSASGSITKSRDVNTQAVFSLRGKPLNCFGLTKKVVYENEEFNLLQAALNIEDGLDGLRYNKVIVATDADVDGMHIRLLMITFFLQFFPDLIKKGHVYILQTPLFRVRNKKKKERKQASAATSDTASAAGEAILKKTRTSDRSEFETIYCYSEEERIAAIEKLQPNPEITRFKGLGEISPEEFRHFIGPEIRLEQVTLHKSDQVKELLEYYMGKNTMERQNFIIDNLVVEEDPVEEEE